MKIKQLMWYQEYECQWQADALSGRYQVLQQGQKYTVRWALGGAYRYLDCGYETFSTLSEAKEVAQADFERVVSECLGGGVV